LSELPQHWIVTSFGSICGSGQYGWTTRAIDKGVVRLLRTTDITKGQIDWNSVPYCQDAPSDLDKYRVQANDILISRAGSVGFSILISHTPLPTVFASYLIRFVSSESIEPRYLAYFLKSSRSILQTKFEQILRLKPSSCRGQDLFFQVRGRANFEKIARSLNRKL